MRRCWKFHPEIAERDAKVGIFEDIGDIGESSKTLLLVLFSPVSTPVARRSGDHAAAEVSAGRRVDALERSESKSVQAPGCACLDPNAAKRRSAEPVVGVLVRTLSIFWSQSDLDPAATA